MERRNFITALLAVPALGLLAACGSDAAGDRLQTSDTTGEEPPASTVPTDTEPVAPTPDSTAPAEVVSDTPVLSYTAVGGYTTLEYAFQNPPIVLLTQSGTLIGQSVVPAVFPGPLLPQHQAQTVTPAGIDAVLAAADAAGLFAEVDYSTDDDLAIADASTATLTITADGTTYTHQAYALGLQSGPATEVTESTPQRRALLDFLTTLQADPTSIFGAENLGAPTDYEPQAYQLIATPVGDLSDFEPAPVVEQWPAESGIELAAATECVEAERSAVGDVLEAATQLTFFSENDVTYQVTARPAYPGRTC